MRMQDFWNAPAFGLVKNKVPESQLFDLSIVKDAAARLKSEKPFG
jgi:hypothetical protein